MQNRTLYFGDNLEILREKIPDESFDLIYLDPPFSSNRSLLQRSQKGRPGVAIQSGRVEIQTKIV